MQEPAKDKEDNDKDENKKKSLVSEEKAETGRITLAVIVAYCRACTWYMVVSVILFNILSNVVSIGTNFWLAEWSTSAENMLKLAINENATVSQVTACDSAGSPVYVCILATQHYSLSCLLYTSPSPRDATLSRMPSSA